MSEICIVCNEEIHLAYRDEVEGIPIHSECFIKFNEDKEFYKQEYIEKFKEMNDQFASETKIPEAKSETKIEVKESKPVVKKTPATKKPATKKPAAKKPAAKKTTKKA